MRDREYGMVIMFFGVMAITPDALFVRLMRLDGGSTLDQDLQAIFWKYLLLIPLIFAFNCWHYGGLSKLVKKALLGPRHIAAGALCQVCISTSLNLAYVTTVVARAHLFFGLSPLWAAFIGRLALGQAVPPRTLVSLVFVSLGIFIVFLPAVIPTLDQGTASTETATSIEPTVHGDLLGVLSGAGLGAMIVVSASAKRRCPDAAMLLSVFFGSTLVVLLAFVWQAAAGRASMGTVSMRFIGLALADGICACLVYIATVVAPRYTNSAEVGLLNPIESILGPLWVYAGVGEVPSSWTIIGGTIIIVSLIANEAWECQTSRKAARDASGSREPSAEVTGEVSLEVVKTTTVVGV